MPGLLTLRPLTSATKAAKGAAAKTAAVSAAARADKVRDDGRALQGHGRAVSPALSRARVLKAAAPALHRDAPAAPAHLHPAHHHPRQQHSKQQHVAPAPVQKQLAVAPAAGRNFAIDTTTNQATDPLHGNPAEAAEASRKQFGVDISQRMVGVDYSSSGSEHEPNSVCLAEMVYDYIEDDLEVSKCGRARCNCGNSCSGADLSTVKENDDSSLGGEITEVLQGLIHCVSPCEKTILASVNLALTTLGIKDDGSDPDDGEKGRASSRAPSTRRFVMSALRSSGYNAAICKSRWEHAGGFPGGAYEYIDVIADFAGRRERIILDVDFKAQFEIARPTSLYSVLLQSLPSIYVGKADRLQQIVNIMSDSAKRSLKKKGLHLPPWRKSDYIRAKWFSAYRRTTNGAPASSTKSPDGTDIAQIALRTSGWDSKFTSEMERFYVKAADLKMALKECTAEKYHDKIPAKAPPQQMMKSQAPEPEGQVRGANLMGFLGLGSDHSAAAGGSDLTVEEWEPPSVIPRTSTQRAAAGKKVGGLVSILKESSESSGGLRKEQTLALEAQELQEQVAVAALHLHRNQAGALSKQMVVA